MATACLVDPLLGGRQALQTSRWEDARAAFEQALAAQETPDANAGLGQALWFLGFVAEAIEARERASSSSSATPAATRPRAWASGSHTGTSSRAERLPPADGWPAPSGRWRAPSRAPVRGGWPSSSNVQRRNEATDGLRMPAEYLIAIGRKAA